MQSLEDYQKAAAEKLPKAVFSYLQKTANHGLSFQANINAFASFQLIPRVLQGIERVDTTVKILEKIFDSPIMIAPTAWHKLFSQRGEQDTACATKALNIPFILSSFSTCDFHELGSNLSHIWYQLLIYHNKALMKRYIAKAEEAGCSAIVLTVDAPLGCSMCKSNTQATESVNFPLGQLPLFPQDDTIKYDNLDDYYQKYIHTAASWRDIETIAQLTCLPIVLKGILHPADIKQAIDSGIKAIILSNHGGRQLDNTISPLCTLALIPDAIKQSIELYVDGGVRQGSDIVKALALGAKAVLIGRPALYGLAVNGQAGLTAVLTRLQHELTTCMHLIGAANLSAITSDSIYKEKI